MTDKQQPVLDEDNRPLTEEELFLEDVIRLQQEALAEERMLREQGIVKKKRQPRTVRFAVYAIVLTMIFSTFAVLFQMFSLPAIEFLKTSNALSKQPLIQTYKEAIVTLNTEDSKGTGFTISSNGYIVTNAHVVEDALTLSASFPAHGVKKATVIDIWAEVDLALVKVNDENLPYLPLAKDVTYTADEAIQFIGNPLAFSGIANEGTMIGQANTSLAIPAIMMDAPVYKGNSGSPVFTKDGSVIGVIYATMKTDAYGKVGLFVPIDALHERFSLHE